MGITGFGPNWGIHARDEHLDFTGKNTERVLMRVPDDMKREVEARARLEHRTVCDQYRHLIALALNHLSAGSVNGTAVQARPPMSTSSYRAKKLSETFVNRAIPPRRRAG